jgi:hypothetical protein
MNFRKFVADVIGTGEQFVTGINDTGCKLATCTSGVVDTVGAQQYA